MSFTSHPRKSADTLFRHLHDDLLRRWYPLVIDDKCGGYFTNISSDWHLAAEQEKMIVSQTRHMWTTSKTAMFLPDGEQYASYALHGLSFIKDFMWDERYGGFYQVRSREGGYSECHGWGEEKRTYGNASGILALASLYRLTKNTSILKFAKDVYEWIEIHARDTEYGGYFQFLTRQGEPIDETSQYHSVASDIREMGLKDQNTATFLLEAYTELYRVWKNEDLGSRLSALLKLLRDTMVTKRGYLQLFFLRDWTPLSYRTASDATRAINYGLDHISFGHDCKNAFLMLEASNILGIDNDVRTLMVAKQMLDHAIDHGWDQDLGGFFDGGYYLEDSDQCLIIKRTKTWWAQAEALNLLLTFAFLFPEIPRYRLLFEKQWEYIDNHILDHRNGDWFEGGLDKQPYLANGPKGDMWKCTYHTGKALMNCVALLSENEDVAAGIAMRRRELLEMISRWKRNRQLAEKSGDLLTKLSSKDA